jgi:hypothetical protein
MTKSCSSGAGGAVLIIEPHLGVIGVCLGGLPTDQSNHQDPPESAFDEPEAANSEPDCFRALIFWEESIRRASTMSIWPRFAKADFLSPAEAALNILRDD